MFDEADFYLTGSQKNHIYCAKGLCTSLLIYCVLGE